MKIVFCNLKAADAPFEREIREAIEAVLDAGQFINGSDVEKFEQEFAHFCGVKHCVAMNSGTAALHLILRAYGIGPGDLVVTVPNSFIATAEAIVHSGAKPIFVDIDPKTLTMDPQRLENLLKSSQGKHIKAILPVHLYGLPADMESIVRLAKNFGVKVVEDACQAHGAKYKGKRAGSLADAAAFSFYPSKNLGAYGDGGGVTTDDPLLSERLLSLRNHGRSGKNSHRCVGYTERLDTLQAAILRVKLRHLQRSIDARRDLARLFTESFSDLPVATPPDVKGEREHVYHLYVLQSKKRDALLNHLKEKGVDADIHYPIPIPFQEAFDDLGHSEKDFPEAVWASQEILSLPLYPGMTSSQAKAVVAAVRSFFAT